MEKGIDYRKDWENPFWSSFPWHRPMIFQENSDSVKTIWFSLRWFFSNNVLIWEGHLLQHLSIATKQITTSVGIHYASYVLLGFLYEKSNFQYLILMISCCLIVFFIHLLYMLPRKINDMMDAFVVNSFKERLTKIRRNNTRYVLFFSLTFKYNWVFQKLL